MKVLCDIAYKNSAHSLQKLDMYLPDGDAFPVFVYFHGGGLEKGDKASAQAAGTYLATHGIAFVSVNYRLYPDAAYPDFIRDAASAAAWVKRHIAEYGGNDRIYVGGSSAGAYLSMMLCFDDRWLAPHRIKPTDFAGFFHNAGQPTKHFNVLREYGEDTRKVVIDDTAPIYHIGKACEYAPMLFLVSDNDMKNRYEQTMLTLSTLKHFGYDSSKIEFELLPGKHCAITKQLDEDGNSVLGKRIEQFINKNVLYNA